MLNHNNDMKLAQSTRITAHRGQPGGGLRAVREYSKGEQVFDYYGQAPNLVLLCEYGFALPGNHLGTPTVLTLRELSHEVGAPQPAKWMHTAPKGGAQPFLTACVSFLQNKDKMDGPQSLFRKRVTSLKLNDEYRFGFEPVGVDCSRTYSDPQNTSVSLSQSPYRHPIQRVLCWSRCRTIWLW